MRKVSIELVASSMCGIFRSSIFLAISSASRSASPLAIFRSWWQIDVLAVFESA